jgi:hypothetical protein
LATAAGLVFNLGHTIKVLSEQIGFSIRENLAAKIMELLGDLAHRSCLPCLCPNNGPLGESRC